MSSTPKNSSRSCNSCAKISSTASAKYSKAIGYLNNSEGRQIDIMIRTSQKVADSKK